MSKPTSHGILSEFPSCSLIVTAAGAGTRFGGYKQLAKVMGKPLLEHALDGFNACLFTERIVVLPEEFFREGHWTRLCRMNPALTEFRAVVGRETRAESVLEGILALRDECEFVAVHDGARPFPPIDGLKECYHYLNRHPGTAAAIVGSRVTDTIKRVGPDGKTITATEPRDELRRAETPQVARINHLARALRSAEGPEATDEADALARHGHRVVCLTHQGFNPKITVPADMAVVEAWLRNRLSLLDETQ